MARFPRWVWQVSAPGWSGMLAVMTDEAGRALGPMLTASSWERCPVYVPLYASCTVGRRSTQSTMSEAQTMAWRLSPPPTPAILYTDAVLDQYIECADRCVRVWNLSE